MQFTGDRFLLVRQSQLRNLLSYNRIEALVVLRVGKWVAAD
jgi:hypothetical protein